MPQIGILKGIYASEVSEFVQSLPMNREPVILDSGLSKGFMRPAPGITPLLVGPGPDRGSITWSGVHYRVLGSKLCRVDPAGTFTVLGDVGNGGPVSMDYGFDRLAIASANKLFYWTGSSFIQVTDPNLGVVLDVIWIAGYFMTTDGTSIVVTELNDPTKVRPLKYGSAEDDPDPIVALKRVRGEVFAIGTNTIQGYSNIGGLGFPFANVKSAEIPRGCVGTHACAAYLETFAFVGSTNDEAPGVYLAGGGTSDKLSNRTVDLALASLSAADLAAVELEVRTEKDEQRLIVHLPTRSYVFFQKASKLLGEPVWMTLASGIGANKAYRGRHQAYLAGRWIVGDAAGNVGYLDASVSTHFGEIAGWQFDTALLTNPDGRAIVLSVELNGLPGNAPFGTRPEVFMSSTIDGRTWGQERAASPGKSGERATNIQWRSKRRIDSFLGMRFRGADSGMATFASLNVEIESLR